MNELEWLRSNRYYEEDIDEAKLKNIFYFTLIWNIFEKTCCGHFAEIGKHPKDIAISLESKINDQIINDIYEYFKNRYILDGSMTDVFHNFKFGKNPDDGKVYKKFVEKTLMHDNSSIKEKTQCLLYIAFRLRNNLYHGIKEVSKLYAQNESFKQINCLLMEIIDARSKQGI